MSLSFNILVLILGIGMVTYISRALPIIALSNKKLNKNIEIWMKYVPPAIFAALILPDIFTYNNSLDFVNPKILSSVIVFFIAYKTRSLSLSIIFGVISISLLI